MKTCQEHNGEVGWWRFSHMGMIPPRGINSLGVQLIPYLESASLTWDFALSLWKLPRSHPKSFVIF